MMGENSQKKKIERRLRRENRLCTQCGEPLPNGWHFVMCDSCHSFFRLKRKARKDMGVCVNCGKEDAYTMMGRSSCADCAAKYAERARRKIISPELADKKKSRQSARIRKMKEQGRCVECGRCLPYWWNHVRCPEHYQRFRDWQKNNRRNKGIISRDEAKEQGLCYQCLKNPALIGHKTCEQCYKKKCESIAKARAAIDRKNHIWNCPKKKEE